jgi:hypothetical protein
MNQQPNPEAFPPGFFFIQPQRFPALTLDVNDGSMTVSGVAVKRYFVHSPRVRLKQKNTHVKNTRKTRIFCYGIR